METRLENLSESDEAVKAFVAACNSMCDAKFLLSERKISDLMQTIAAYPRLYEIFKNALKGYNRQAEFHKSKTKVGGRSKLVPPQKEWYIDTKEPFDKAGGYGIQGKCAIFIEKISGDYNNVVGLPVARIYQELLKLGVDIYGES